jgi:hypothetical protein
MPKHSNTQSTLIIGLTAALLATSASAEVTRREDGPPGVYSVGHWEGRCVRDGWLNGADHESCGAVLDGFVSVYISRDVKGLVVSMNKDGCKRGPAKAKMTVKQLAQPDRAEKLETLIRKLAVKQQKRCGPEGEMYAATKEDLAEILKETDGLEF